MRQGDWTVFVGWNLGQGFYHPSTRIPETKSTLGTPSTGGCGPYPRLTAELLSSLPSCFSFIFQVFSSRLRASGPGRLTLSEPGSFACPPLPSSRLPRLPGHHSGLPGSSRRRHHLAAGLWVSGSHRRDASGDAERRSQSAWGTQGVAGNHLRSPWLGCQRGYSCSKE